VNVSCWLNLILASKYEREIVILKNMRL